MNRMNEKNDTTKQTTALHLLKRSFTAMLCVLLLAATSFWMHDVFPYEYKGIFHKTALPAKFKSMKEYEMFRLNRHTVVYVDFDKPRFQRRLWVVERGKVVATSFVSHGAGSGKYYPVRFSNRPGSKMSSLGMYSFTYLLNYRSRPFNRGYKITLKGLETINNKAAERNIVIHTAKYVSERGCRGNSEGCFVVSREIFDLLKKMSRLRKVYLLASG